MSPRADPDAVETARLMNAVRSVGAGKPTADAPGLAERLPADVRERLALAAGPERTIEALGDERIGPRHFVANPAIVRLRRYRTIAKSGAPRYLTLQLDRQALLVGTIVED
jgi:hypothetical protein